MRGGSRSIREGELSVKVLNCGFLRSLKLDKSRACLMSNEAFGSFFGANRVCPLG